MRVGIILAGGSGKRLWPLSREKKPKQLLNLFEERPFLINSIDRLSPCVDEIVISTGKNLENEITKIIPEKKLIVEPERRDTAAAIGLCATQFSENDVLVFTPSDAYINPNTIFQKNIEKAITYAQNNDAIVVVGIPPNHPSTAYGYIETKGENKINRFYEKPSKEKAEEYIKKGYLWNAGIFVSKSGTLMDLFKKHAPDIFETLEKIKETGEINENYQNIRKTSFDYAVMEKAKNVMYVPAEFDWNDVGGFPAIMEVLKKENVTLLGKLEHIESSGNILHTHKNKTIALIDCKDLIVIDTKDALLVCPTKSANKIKDLAEKVHEKLK